MGLRVILLGAVAPILLLLAATAAAADHVSRGSGLATGSDLLGEIQQLKAAIVSIQNVIKYADIPANSPIMSDAAKLIRRVSSLVYATDLFGSSLSGEQLRTVRREERVLHRKVARLPRRVRGGMEAPPPDDGERKMMALVGGEEEGMPKDDLERMLYMVTTTFPECRERLLDHCLGILNHQLLELQMDCDFVIHEKRTPDQDGYHKVVIVTDLSATVVKGRLGDGIVDYPFEWDDAMTGHARQLGVGGKWDCRALTPEDCCRLVQQSAPGPDRRGNMLACHIFVPFGGVGHKKRDDRVFINVSPDGRVHESPFIS